jgi:hypothetical protein
LRSLAIPGILEPRSASSACSIAGISACSFIKEALEKRFAECGLQLHPEKTKIVYCKDDDRRGNSKNESFDFLGYSFRARRSKNRFGKFFVNFSPGVSNAATKAIREEIRRWQLRCRIDKWIDDLARMFNPVIRGGLACSGTGCFASGEKHSVGVVKRAGSLGLAALPLPNNGFLVLRSSIHIPKFVSPLVIQDKSRMR